ncbi:MAG: TlpA family protein disulfide reductase [Chitinophagaceae bacterium]|nr:MAG: TlpA family protein disulfide reductase [Chitinophagaceae bacterium]
MIYRFIISCIFAFGQLSFANAQHPVSDQAAAPTNGIVHTSGPTLPEGKWRGEFQLRPEVTVPFNFEITGRNNSQVIIFYNGDEQFEGGRVHQQKDSLFIPLDQFGNVLAFKFAKGRLAGTLRKQDGSGSPTKVTAQPANGSRFPKPGKAPEGEMSGTYEVAFMNPDGTIEKGVGLFEQEGAIVKGTFLRITGDSRYLEGVVDGNHFQMSSFIGSSPSYYRGSISADGTISGEIVGAQNSLPFTASPNEDARLTDPYKLTYLKEGYNEFDFSFPDVDGRQVSLKDPRFKNKVVVVTISGTWCPNCMDETNFLVPWYNANKDRGVEIVSLHYERQTDPVWVKTTLNRYRERFKVPYIQLFAGKADKQAVAASLPSLNSFLSYPTTIIIDRQGKVSKIHTGFSGPATGKFYDEFVREFNRDIDALLKN